MEIVRNAASSLTATTREMVGGMGEGRNDESACLMAYVFGTEEADGSTMMIGGLELGTDEIDVSTTMIGSLDVEIGSMA